MGQSTQTLGSLGQRLLPLGGQISWPSPKWHVAHGESEGVGTWIEGVWKLTSFFFFFFVIEIVIYAPYPSINTKSNPTCTTTLARIQGSMQLPRTFLPAAGRLATWWRRREKRRIELWSGSKKWCPWRKSHPLFLSRRAKHRRKRESYLACIAMREVWDVSIAAIQNPKPESKFGRILYHAVVVVTYFVHWPNVRERKSGMFVVGFKGMYTKLMSR